jgi:protein SCO1/2
MAHGAGLAAKGQSVDCQRPLNGPNAGYFPNLVVVTHENRRALFYDDLLRGKIVLVNFMSIKDEAVHRATETLVEVQSQLLRSQVIRSQNGDHLDDVFMYSITVDPWHDTPQALAEFAEQHGVQPGWLFLTAAPDDIESLRSRFFAHAAHSAGPAADCSMSMIRYGNEAAGIWGAAPTTSPADAIATRVSWVQSRPLPVGPSRRKGPMPLELSAGRPVGGQ